MNLLNKAKEIGRDYLLYPAVASVVPGRHQPALFKRLPGALKQGYESSSQLEMLINEHSELSPETVEAHTAWQSSCVYSYRSGFLEAIAAPFIGIGAAILIAINGSEVTTMLTTAAIYAANPGITLGGMLDGIMRSATVEKYNIPNCIGKGLIVFAQSTTGQLRGQTSFDITI